MKLFKLFKNSLVKIIRYVLPQKRIKASSFNYTLNIKREDIEYIIRSNIVLKIKRQNDHVYFRHCFPQLCIKDYVVYLISYYFTYLFRTNETKSKTQLIIENSLKNKSNYKKFIKMGCWKNKHDPSGQYITNHNNPLIIGIDSNNSISDEELTEFVKFASVMLENWKMNNWFGNKKDGVQSYHASIEFAYHDIASVFGAGNLLPKIWFGHLAIDGEKYFGYFMQEVDGVLANSYSKEQRVTMVSPILQMKLNNIFITDYICGVYDHAPYNYNITLDQKGVVKNIGFFDNNEGGAFPMRNVKPEHVSPLLVDKKFNRPFIDSRIASTIESIQKKEIMRVANKYLSLERARFCWKRINNLKIALKHNDSKPQIIKENQWNFNTLSNELSGDYGRTYVNLFLGNGK